MRGWTGGGGLEPGVRGVEVKRKIEKSKKIKKIKIKRGGRNKEIGFALPSPNQGLVLVSTF